MMIAKPVEVNTPSDREIEIVRTFAAPRQLVFEALTTPDLVKRWLTGPPGWEMVVCDIDLRVGGSFRYVLRGDDGTEMGWGGSYREIDPPVRLVHTELFDQDWTGGETVVTTTLSERDGVTTLTMRILYSSQKARDGALETPMTDGLGQSFDRLEDVITGG